MPETLGSKWLSKRLLVVSAHSADFVWRAAGAIATVVEGGGEAHVVSLSYGERGESGELWKEAGQTEERVKEIRHGEALTAATALGAGFRSLDLGDYPLVMDAAAVETLTDLLRELEPQLIITHAALDPVQPRPRRRARRDGAGAPARERRRRGERVQDDRAARAADLRAASARAVRVRADDVPRHHARVGQEAGGDGGHGRAGLPQAVLLRARRAPRQPRAAHLRPQGHQAGRGLHARDPRREDAL